VKEKGSNGVRLCVPVCPDNNIWNRHFVRPNFTKY